MPSDKLTPLQVKNLKPAAKPYRLSDGGGLFVEVRPGGGMYWRLAYRFGGKQKTLAIGVHGKGLTLKAARKARDDARALLENGVDPAEHRKLVKYQQAEASTNTFGAIAARWYAKKSQEWAKSNATRIWSRMQRDILPWLGSRPVAEITGPEVLRTIQRIEERGAVETARRCLTYCGSVFRLAIAEGHCTQDPTFGLVEVLAKPKPTHFAAITKPAEVGALLRALDGYQGTFVVKQALRLAPLVFVRPGELRQAEWSEIAQDAALWTIPLHKIKSREKREDDHLVPLSTQALEIIRELEPLTGGGRYLFPNPRGASRPMSENAVLSALRRMGYPKDQMTGHGFRAMARTLLDEELGFRVDWIEHQLAHAVRDPNGRAYNRATHIEDRRRMMQAWADYLDQLKSGADVIRFRQRGE